MLVRPWTAPTSPSSKDTQSPHTLQAPVKTRLSHASAAKITSCFFPLDDGRLLRRVRAPGNTDTHLAFPKRPDEAAEGPHRGLKHFNEEQRNC